VVDAFSKYQHMVELALLTVFPGAVLFAASMDLFTMTIPNRVSLALVAAFVLLAPLLGFGPWDIASHLGAGLVVLAGGILLFIPGWIGGGDAKLAAAVALWLGFDHVTIFLLCAALAGGSLASAILALRQMPVPAVIATQPWAARLLTRGGGIPYGIALAVSALWVYPQSAWFTNLVG
jgi:prepilin peptidase CpaA